MTDGRPLDHEEKTVAAWMDKWDLRMYITPLCFYEMVDALCQARREERERCTRVAEEEGQAAHFPDDRWDQGYRRAATMIAEALRHGETGGAR